MADKKGHLKPDESRRSSKSSHNQRESMRSIKKEICHSPQRSVVRAITPDDEIPLDYVEEPDVRISPKKKHKLERAEDDLATQKVKPASNGSLHHNGKYNNGDEVELQSPDEDEDVLDENLELRSLNDEPIAQFDENEEGRHQSLSARQMNRSEAISDDDDSGQILSREAAGREHRRRPRTPLSPCPDNVSQNGDPEVDMAESSNEFSRGHRRRIWPRINEDRSISRDRGIYSRVIRRHGESEAVEEIEAVEMPDAYREQLVRRRPRGGRRVREIRLRRTAVDSRILANRRNRLMRLREAAQVRRTGAIRSDESARLPLRRGSPEFSTRRFSSSRHCMPLPTPSRIIDYDPREYRRNPSYYPQFSSDSRTSASTRRLTLLPSATPRRRTRSPIPPVVPRRLTPNYRPLERRMRSPIPAYAQRSRFPSERMSNHLAPRRRSPSSMPSHSYSRFNDRRRANNYASIPPLPRRQRSPAGPPSRYMGSGRDQRFREPFPNERRGGRENRGRLPLPPIKYWRCAKRERTPN